MRVLVVNKPRLAVQPEQLPILAQAALDWLDRHRDSIESFGVFPGGGGFGVVNVADEDALHQMMMEMPFTPFGDVTITPVVDGDSAFARLVQFAEAMSAGGPPGAEPAV